MTHRASVVVLGLLIACGCQVLGGFEDFEGGVDMTEKQHPCAALPEAKDDALGLTVMSRVDIPDGSCAWVDRSEVTVEQYQRWIDETTSEEIEWEQALCRWKAERSDPVSDPDDECRDALLSFDLQPFAPRKPMRCVDFCDAEAFCRWAGKHLCRDESALGTQWPRGYDREWFVACSNGLTTTYPWGNDEAQNPCNTRKSTDSCFTDNPECGPTLAGQNDGCVNQAGVQDLIGNVAEWTFSCTFVSAAEPLNPSKCMTRGGHYDAELQPCDVESTTSAEARLPTLGFRCCADLTASEQLAVPQ